MGIELTYPYLLLLLLPCVFLMYSFWKNSRLTMNRSEKVIVITLRSLVFFLLIFALTIPQLLLPVKGTTVVFLADQSASVDNKEEDILAWIEASVDKKAADDAFAVASFGGDAAAEQAVTKKETVISQLSSEVDETETSIEAGIRFASSFISNDENGRIVLFSDGNETIGHAAETVKLLHNKGIELDVVPIQVPVKKDASLTDLSVSPSLYQGEKADISVSIASDITQEATIRISLNDKEIIKKSVAVKEGNNVFGFSHIVTETGMHVYKAEIAAKEDAYAENNTLHAITNVKGTPKVLIVEENRSSLSSILSGNGFDVEAIVPEKLPTTLSGFLQYQSVVFNNVSATSISQNQMQLIEQSVKEFGNGFVMTGGENSFGLGGYFKTPIEKLLPVDMDVKGKKEMPSLGLVIVMDRSGSMSGNKLSLAKEAAARSVELLEEGDTFGFIAFDDRPWQIVETEPLKDKEAAMDQIRSVASGGGTEIYRSLELAYEQLQDKKLQRKHIILLTDGQSPRNDYEALIEEGKEQNITLSTVSIGNDADKLLLEELAQWGAGRYYDVVDSSVIPSILSRETVMATKTYIEDNRFYPTIQQGTGWNSLFADGVPQMNAYIATTAKERAKEPLISGKEDPVLAEWQYGMGTTIAFTSDIMGKWSGNWPRWNQWGNFLNQMITTTLPKYESEPYTVTMDHSGDETVLSIQAATNNIHPLSASIVSEKGDRIDSHPKLVAPGKYEMTVPNQSGLYFLSVQQDHETGASNLYQTGFTIPYSKEYVQQGLNQRYIDELLATSGGQELKKEASAFRDLKEMSQHKQSISAWLLCAAFLLFFVEIIIRRFGWQRLCSFFTRKKQGIERSKAETTVKRLKQAKQTVERGPNKSMQVEEQKQATGKSQLKQMDKKLSPSEREERMKRLLEAKRRKH